TPAFKTYAHQIVKNAKTLAEELLKKDYKLVTGGTDNHLLLIDLSNKKIMGADAETALGKAGITVNKNTVPFDPRPPFSPSGIRMGTPALTTRGMKEKDMKQIAQWIDDALINAGDDAYLGKMRQTIKDFCLQFPLPE